MSILLTPTNPKTTLEDIKAFLSSLQEYPGGPSVTSSPISFTDHVQKELWILYFPDVNFRRHFTYSESFKEKFKDNTRNRIALFKRPAGNWVGVPADKTTWTYADWHAFGIAWIKTPNATSSKDLVVYDLEGYFPDEVKKWQISSMPLISDYVKFCGKGNSKKKINNIWIWQDKRHRKKGKCLKHTLEWLKQMTMIGERGLSSTDWESLGVK